MNNYNIKDVYKYCLKEGIITEDIDYNTFSNIIREFHKDISRKILKGYKYKLNHNLGLLQVIKDIRRGKTINWGDSNKLKQVIIDRGDVPYDREKAPDGIKWLVYYIDSDYFKWNWYKINEFVKNLKYYIFKPCTFNRRNIKKVIEEDDFVTETYGKHKQANIL